MFGKYSNWILIDTHRGRLTNGGKNVEKAFKDFSVYKLDSIEAVQEFFKSNLELVIITKKISHSL